jgi:4-amino-4-deoxy-L-arabinose transferase-like glycosyltransferase
VAKKSKKQRQESVTTKPAAQKGFGDSRYIGWALLILMILLTIVIRLRLLDIPLERDEGEFAYMGQLILQGIPPYQISYNLKLPGIYAAYALMMFLFGQSTAGIHLGLIVVNAATTILLYAIGVRLFDRFVALIAGCAYAVLSLSPTVVGTSAHATHFVLLPALAAILLMLQSMESKKMILLLWSGILLGLSFLMKQHGLFFGIFSLLFLFYTSLRSPDSSIRLFFKQGSLLLAGAIIPVGIACAILYVSGVFDQFWHWTVSYAYQYVAKTTLSTGVRSFLVIIRQVIGNFYFFWILAAVGAGFLFLEKSYRNQIPFVLGFFLFSFLAVCPGFYFRYHYFILLLPAVSLLAGIGAGGARQLFLSRHPRFQFIPVIVFAIVLLHALFQYRAFFFQWTPYQASRAIYASNPFPESVEIAAYINAHSSKEDKIAVIGSEPQIYFYADRHSATGHIYTYALMENQKYAQQMQREMIEEVEKASPRYLIFVAVPASWLIEPGSDKHIFRWFDQFSRREYDLMGVVDIGDGKHTQYRWGDQAKLSPPQSPNHILVFERKR